MENLPEDFFVTSFQFTEHTYRDQYPTIDAAKNSELSLNGKVVVITGASRGIGATGFVPEFAKAGPKAIVLAARDATRLESVAAEVAKINPTVETLIAPTDIGSTDAVKGLFATVTAKYGYADILINNAAVNAIQGNLADVDPETWWNSFAVNARGTFLVTSYFLKALPPTAQGTIVSLTTGMGWGVYPGNSSYALSKMINLQMAAYVGAESAGNVTSVALHPGIVMTDMTQEAFKPFAQDTPALVGGTALWLCQNKARFLNGKTICVNWSMDDLYARREEVVKEGLLNIDLKGKFGAEQFQNELGSSTVKPREFPHSFSRDNRDTLPIMENPEQNIQSVLEALCQGAPAEQTEAINTYFLPDAAFQHPFCRVPAFSQLPFGLFSGVNSRWVLLMIYRWYRILSPDIDFHIDSCAFDKRTQTLYLNLRQTFTVWFIPFYVARVRLVTVLHLEHLDKRTAADNLSSAVGGKLIADDQDSKKRYYIAEQDDHYQVNDFVKFVAPGIGPLFCSLWQIVSTAVCMLGVWAIMPVYAALESKPRWRAIAH